MTALYVLLAVLALSFLIFIHELGHYWMARRSGMRVETFSIGFGKPLCSWMHDGVKWQIGWLLFGGYVKIAGMDSGDASNPYEVEGGFFSKRPIERIKVAFMGPFVNILFALLVFAALWSLGGRQKNFSEFTHKIGWIDSHSELYAAGVRPGDEIVAYGNHPFEESKDHIYGPTTSNGQIEVVGNKVDLLTGRKTPFNYSVKTYPLPLASDKSIQTAGVLQPASYIIYDRLSNGQENPLPEGSPMRDSGIQYGDRVVWMDGEPIYSVLQMHQILNDNKVFLTIQRGSDILFRRVPRVRLGDLRLDNQAREELVDWQFEANLKGEKFQNLFGLPYNLNNNAVVEATASFIDKDSEAEVFPKQPFSSLESPLQAGDRILAVDGVPVIYSFEVLAALQLHHVNIVVQRDVSVQQRGNWQEADEGFDHQFKAEDLRRLTSEIGISPGPNSFHNLYLLRPVIPKAKSAFDMSPEKRALMETARLLQKNEIDKIEDSDQRAHAVKQFEKGDRQMLLGLPLQDQKVVYNPDPLTLFRRVCEDIWRTLTALVTGSLNPKLMSGPVGIIQAAYDSSMVSLKEGLYLLGIISLNLGVLNLLPLPVLDGGTICLSFYEMLTGRQLKAKTLERIVIPFALVLIGFFIFITYNDVIRLFKGFFH